MTTTTTAAADRLTEAIKSNAATYSRGVSEGTYYVWGRQDERGSQDTGPSMEFAKVWGALMAMYAAEALNSHGTIQNCYLEWAATGSLTVTVSMRDQRGVFAIYCPGEFDEPTIAPVPWSDGDYAGSHRYREPAQRRVRDIA